jgi:DNA polymerase-3 subunit delta'
MTGLIGQQLAGEILGACLARERNPGLIFFGPSGVGKRTAALLFAQAANCRSRRPGGSDPCQECAECRRIGKLAHPDVKLLMPLKPETDADDDARRARDSQQLVEETLKRATEFGLGMTRPASEAKWQISIHLIHWLRREMAYAPLQARRRIVIVLDADQMNLVSANALLKTLEEPQKDTQFILTTERRHRLPETIRSRCQQVSFGLLSPEEIAVGLTGRGIGAREATTAAVVSGGSLRRALEFLEQPEEFLVPQAVEFFGRGQPTTEDCLALAEQADRLPVEGVLDSLIFLHDQALHAVAGLSSGYAAQNHQVMSRAMSLTVPAVLRRLEILLRARKEYELNVNRRLFLFSVLAALAADKGQTLVPGKARP